MMSQSSKRIAHGVLLFALSALGGHAIAAEAPPEKVSIPSVEALAGELDCRVDFFRIGDRAAFLIRPPQNTFPGPTPWVWYAPVIGHPNKSHAWMLRQWLQEGIGMAGVDVGESYGSPEGRRVFTALWRRLTEHYRMSPRPCLLPQSRGGLMLYNWAVENPGRVACIAGIYTVCDLRSYPGLDRACGAYGLSAAQLEAQLDRHNPVSRLKPLAEAGTPILHIHGDSDRIVPLEANSGQLAERYGHLGGPMRLVVVSGKGHEVCPEFFQRRELVDFVVAHARAADGESGAAGERACYDRYVRACLDTLIEHGTDRYGPTHSPVLVSILDTRTLACPPDVEPLDEAYRVTRRERRNPAASDLETDQALLKTMVLFSSISGDRKYAEFARTYAAWVMENLVDPEGLFWWGWHRRYDVFDDTRKGHSGDHHEIHAIHEIQWDLLWSVNAEAVARQIEAVWRLHVVDKVTGEVNRHADGMPGCDFSMSAGGMIEAFAFMYRRTGDGVWLDRAKLLADYYWRRRDERTDLFADRPNAGLDRFDGSAFVTAIPGLYCHSLMKAWRLTGEVEFRDRAAAHLKAYAKYGYDSRAERFWGALRLDGTPIPGPPSTEGYAMYEPRGHLDLWEPYVAGYQYAIYSAQAFACAGLELRDEEFLEAGRRFARWIERSPPGIAESHPDAWYHAYAAGPGRQGTYAGKYGRAVSFLLTMYLATGEGTFLDLACRLADEAIEKLWDNGLFRGHPAKPYYESIDGVGYLLYGLLQLDCVLEDRQGALARKAIEARGEPPVALPLENW